jgi:hypothetical protein
MSIRTDRLSRERRADTVRVIVNGIQTTIVAVAFAALTSWVLVNWIAGCGELIHTADGTMLGECIMVPWAQ